MRYFPKLLAAMTSVSLLLHGAQVRAAAFDPESVMTDTEMRAAGTMTYDDVVQFLDSKGGLREVSSVDPVDGQLKNAAQLIIDASNRYQVNPKYVLALIQKESGAVETVSPTSQQLDWATGYALCDGCYKSAELAQKYKGFGRQVDAGAGWVDWFWKNAAQDGSYRQMGKPAVIDGVTIVPRNTATAALYTYTPHIHGNQLLWRIMDRWFGGNTGPAPRFPDGTLVRNPKNGAVALIQGAKFRPILKASVLTTRFNASRIVNVTEAEFARMDQTMRGAAVRFPDLSLVRDESGATYLLIGSRKRRIVSPQVFSSIGFNPEEVEGVSSDDLTEYADDTPITGADEYLTGSLLQDPKSGGVYYVENGEKRPIWDRAILTANFPGKKLEKGSLAELAALPTGAPVRFDDGALLKNPTEPTVYVVSLGKLRAIPTESAFAGLGFSFKNVLTASSRALALHELGKPLEIPVP